LLLALFLPTGGDAYAQSPARTLAVRSFRDKLWGAWVGELAIGGWGEALEFKHCGTVVPQSEVPAWTAPTVNVDFGSAGDQVSVELPFLEALANRGVFAGWDAFGSTFRDMTFDQLFSANVLAQQNLRNGIPAPTSGLYGNTGGNAENQSWEMESDWTGMVVPGQVNAAIDLNWRAGHVAFYAEGVYGGVMIAAMHAAAFFAASVDEIVDAGRRAVPTGSAYRRMIEDVIAWHAQYPTDWTLAWQQVQARYGASVCTLKALPNGAYVLLGLLYGGGDLEQSGLIAIRAGQDTDCTAQNVGAILGNWLGLSGVPAKFKVALDPNIDFWRTQWTLNTILRLSEDLAREAVLATGGAITGSGDDEVWTIPAQAATVPPILEQIPVGANTPPTLQARIDAQSGRTVTFSATAADADGIAAFEWSFGDLTRAGGASATHTYLQDGYYQVTCYVTDRTGNTSWTRLDVAIGVAATPSVVTMDAVDASASVAGPVAGRLSITRVGPTNADLVVRYALAGTAANGVDYDPLPGQATIKAGFATENVLVRPRSTGAGKTVRLTVLDEPAYRVGTARDGTVTIFATLPSAPAAPSGVRTTASGGGITVAWNASAGATAYNVYRATAAGGEDATPYLRGVTATSILDAAVAVGTTYYYVVTAMNAVDESARSSEASARSGVATPTPRATTTPPPGCVASSTLRQTGTNGDYFRQIASDNSIRVSDRQRLRNTASLTICGVSAYLWNAGPVNGSTVTTGTFHLEVWSDAGGVPGVQLGGDSSPIDAATLPAMQGQAPVQLVVWTANPPRPSGDFWLVLQSDSLSNDQLAWSAAAFNPSAYADANYDAWKLGVDKHTDFTFTVFTAGGAAGTATPAPSPLATPTIVRTATTTQTRSATPSATAARSATPSPRPTTPPPPGCIASSTLRQTGTNGDYFRQIASDNSIVASDRQRLRNTVPLTICGVSAYFWSAGLVNGSTLTTGTFHLEVWSDAGGVPGVQLGGDSSPLDAATLPAVQGQAPVQLVVWAANPPRPSGDFWLVLQSDSLSNDQLAWSAAAFNPSAYADGNYDAWKLAVDKNTDFTFTVYTQP
jgi:ADP-ribosylglycohydrolase